MARSQGSDSALFLSPMKPTPHGYEYEAITNSEGKVLGYKWKVKTETLEEFYARCEFYGFTAEDLVERPVTKWYVRLWNKFKHWLKNRHRKAIWAPMQAEAVAFIKKK
jgi:hypothetical protein